MQIADSCVGRTLFEPPWVPLFVNRMLQNNYMYEGDNLCTDYDQKDVKNGLFEVLMFDFHNHLPDKSFIDFK